MHGIIAMSKELLETPTLLMNKGLECAQTISDCADHLLGLVNDILDFARIESEHFELEYCSHPSFKAYLVSLPHPPHKQQTDPFFCRK